MSDEACPGPCNNAYRRARAIYDAARRAHDRALARLPDGADPPDPPEIPRMRPWAGAPVWCLACTAIVRAALAELDDLAGMLGALPPGVPPAIDGIRDQVKVTVSRDDPSPSPAADTLDDLAGWLRHWESRAKRSDERPRRGFLATEITVITSWLVSHLDPILARRDLAEKFGTETLRWHRQLVAAANAAKESTHVKQPCPKPPAGCGRYSLWERPGETYIMCVNPNCGRRITREELDQASCGT